MEVFQVMEHWVHFLRDHMSWTTSSSLEEQPIFCLTNKVEQLRGFNRTSLGNSIKRANRTCRCHHKLLSRGSTNIKKQIQKPAVNNRRWKSPLMAKKSEWLGMYDTSWEGLSPSKLLVYPLLGKDAIAFFRVVGFVEGQEVECPLSDRSREETLRVTWLS